LSQTPPSGRGWGPYGPPPPGGPQGPRQPPFRPSWTGIWRAIAGFALGLVLGPFLGVFLGMLLFGEIDRALWGLLGLLMFPGLLAWLFTRRRRREP
jgi:MFS family permease